jgi:hypothetical protein
MKGVSFRFRRVNHAELEFPPLAKICGFPRRIFPSEADILVWPRPLGVAALLLIRKIMHPGKMPVFSLVVLTFLFGRR